MHVCMYTCMHIYAKFVCMHAYMSSACIYVCNQTDASDELHKNDHQYSAMIAAYYFTCVSSYWDLAKNCCLRKYCTAHFEKEPSFAGTLWQKTKDSWQFRKPTHRSHHPHIGLSRYLGSSVNFSRLIPATALTTMSWKISLRCCSLIPLAIFLTDKRVRFTCVYMWWAEA